MRPSTITGGRLVELTGMTDKQVHSWCMAGVFGPRHTVRVGSGVPRRFTAEEVVVALACRRVHDALTHNGRGGAPYSALVDVARQVRAGATAQLTEHVRLVVDVADLQAEAAA